MAAVPQEVRPIGIAETVVPRRNGSDFRRAVDPPENPVARLLRPAEKRVDVPTDEFALPVHHLAGNQDVADVPGVHHRHDRAWHVVHRPCVDVPRLEHDDVGFLAWSQRADFAQKAASRGARDGKHLDALTGRDQLRDRQIARIALSESEIVG